MENVSGFSIRRLGVVSALIALVASLLVVPAQEPAFASVSYCNLGTVLTFSGGSGTGGSPNPADDDPFIISTAADLETLANCASLRDNSTYNASTVYYKLDRDIEWIDDKPIGLGSNPFRANFDGGGFAIHSFSQTGSGSQKGLFGEGTDCSISNLTVSGQVTSSTSSSEIGVVMGESDGCDFDNVTAYGVVTSATSGRAGGVVGEVHSSTTLDDIASHVDVIVTHSSSIAGGIVGHAADSAIADVEFSPLADPNDGNVTRGKMAISSGSSSSVQRGGVAGYISDTTLTRATVSAPITGTWGHTLGSYLGGLVGEAQPGVNETGSISDSRFSGSIALANASTATEVGGLVGHLRVPLEDSHSSGDITITTLGSGTKAEIGGAVGKTASGAAISRVSSTGNLTLTTDNGTGKRLGGLVGHLASTNITESFAKVNATGFTTARFGALVGYSNGTTLPEISDSFSFGTVTASGAAVSQVAGLVSVFGTGFSNSTSTPSEDGTTVDNLYTFVNVGSSGYAVNESGGTFGATGTPIYWNSTQSGTNNASGAALHRDNPPDLIELTEVKFADEAAVATNFPGWDFTSSSPTWTMGTCAPYLTWMGSNPVGLCPPVAPDPPTITGVTAGNGQLTVAFTPGSDGGSAITDYEYSTTGTDDDDFESSGVTSSPVTITGLTNGTAYTVWLRAVNAAGESAESVSSSGTPVAPTPPPADPSPSPSPAPAPAPEPDPAPAPAPRPAAVPTPPAEPPVVSTPARPSTPPAPTPPPAADPAPEAPAGPGAVFLRAEEIFEGTITLGTDTEELIMPAFVLQDIATQLAPDGAPLEEGALVIESGSTMIAVLIIQLGDVRLSAADMGNAIQFTLNIPGFESSSMTVAVQKQALVWAFWIQMGLLGVSAAIAVTMVWLFVARNRRRKNDGGPSGQRMNITPPPPPMRPGGALGI